MRWQGAGVDAWPSTSHRAAAVRADLDVDVEVERAGRQQQRPATSSRAARGPRGHVVLTMSRLQGRWWVTLLGTDPSRKNRVTPGHALVAHDQQVEPAGGGLLDERRHRVGVDHLGVDGDAGCRRGWPPPRPRRPRALSARPAVKIVSVASGGGGHLHGALDGLGRRGRAVRPDEDLAGRDMAIAET